MREYSVLDIDRNLFKFGKISSRELMADGNGEIDFEQQKIELDNCFF